MRILGRRSSSNVQKVLWLLGELGVGFEREDVGGQFGGNQSAAYLSLNPNGVVPTLLDDGFVLWESNSICRYLATKFGPTSLYPKDLRLRAICERWMDWQLSSLSPALAPFYVQMVRTPLHQRNDNLIAESRRRSVAVLDILDRAVAGTPFLDSEELTLADICNGIWAHRWFALNAGYRGSHSNLWSWYERLSARHTFRERIIEVPLD